MVRGYSLDFTPAPANSPTPAARQRPSTTIPNPRRFLTGTLTALGRIKEYERAVRAARARNPGSREERAVELHIRSRNLDLDADLRALISRRMTAALERFEERIRTLWVLVSDVNGPRGGHDKHVRAELQLNDGESVLIEEQAHDAGAAAASAADRVGQVLGRLMNRRAAQRRQRHTVRGGGMP